MWLQRYCLLEGKGHTIALVLFLMWSNFVLNRTFFCEISWKCKIEFNIIFYGESRIFGLMLFISCSRQTSQYAYLLRVKFTILYFYSSLAPQILHIYGRCFLELNCIVPETVCKCLSGSTEASDWTEWSRSYRLKL